MTKEEYKEHLCDVICMVFKAEDNVNRMMPNLKDMLKSREVSADRYLGMIADEIMSKDTLPVWENE